jgi:hypothetical protein
VLQKLIVIKTDSSFQSALESHTAHVSKQQNPISQ